MLPDEPTEIPKGRSVAEVEVGEAASAEQETEAEGQPLESVQTAKKLLVDWANQQDGWVRLLATAALSSPQGLSDQSIDHAYAHYLAEKDLSEDEVSTIAPLVFDLTEQKGADAFTIDSLSDVTGVNALASDQTIDFNAGLTILFGENGSGKTGYSRILKALGAVRTAEEILPNVHDAQASKDIRCSLSYTADGETKTLAWSGETGVSPFTSVSIFDSPAVQLHVDEDLSYLYTPSDLALFPLMTEGIERVRDRLDGDIAEREPSGNPFLNQFTRGSSVYTLIETLGSATDLAALTPLAKSGSDSEAELTSLEASVQALGGGAITAQIAVARSRRDLYVKLTEFADVAAGFDDKAFMASVNARDTAEADYQRLRAELVDTDNGEADPDVAEHWQAFILAGVAYQRLRVGDEYPHEGDTCVYCRQPLEEGALGVLRRYREFAEDASRKRSEDAQAQIGLLGRSVLALDLAAAEEALAAAREDEGLDAQLDAMRQWLISLREARAPIEQGKEVDWKSIAVDAEAIRTESQQRAEKATALLDTLTGKEGDRAKELEKVQGEHRDLRDRLELGRRLESIETYVEQAKWAERAGKLSKRFRGLLRSLTETAKVASETLLNTDFEERFKAECAALRAPSVGLVFPGRRGEPARRKTISADHKPSQVLSEGEQKVIALADFLSEAALRWSPAPLVFDDPVSSLDYRRITEVSNRITGLAAERQVVVFTHNIWFAVELLSRFEKNRDACTYYRVSEDSGKGTIVQGVHPRWDTVKGTKGRINSTIQSAKQRDGEEREALIERSYSLIRTWCEVVVEEELFAGVLGRFAPNVMMSKLEQLKPDRIDAAVAAILPIFEKACRLMEGHSQPLESLGVTPSLEELEGDWATLQEARKNYLA